MSGYRYGTARGLSTAEKLTGSQVEALRVLAARDPGKPWVYASSRNAHGCVARPSVEVLIRLGLAEPECHPRADGTPGPRCYPYRFRITDTGRAILAGRLSLDAEQETV